jgi:hypothetical protein
VDLAEAERVVDVLRGGDNSTITAQSNLLNHHQFGLDGTRATGMRRAPTAAFYVAAFYCQRPRGGIEWLLNRI